MFTDKELYDIGERSVYNKGRLDWVENKLEEINTLRNIIRDLEKRLEKLERIVSWLD